MQTHASNTGIVETKGALGGTRFAKDQLKSIIERIERLEEEKKTITDDIKDVYAEAKGNGLRRQGAAHHRQDAKARTRASGKSRRPSWRRICRRWGCCDG
jgi:hypothetical protein